MSPKNSISLISPVSFLATESLSSRITLSSINFTIGPSIVSQTVTAVAFPGLSILSWVPVAIYLFSIDIVAGCMDVDEYPEVLPLPYLSLNPPDANGYVRTGLPATRSSINVYTGSILLPLPSSFALTFFWRRTKSSKNAQCSMPKFFAHTDIIFQSFDAFCARHSPNTRQAPLLILLVSILLRSL